MMYQLMIFEQILKIHDSHIVLSKLILLSGNNEIKVNTQMKRARMYLSLLSLLMLMLFVMPAQAAIWKAENTWDSEWENRYREWVSENWKEDFFMNPDKPLYYKLEHDCADAVYLMRLIFAYENSLPFVINNMHGKGDISNTMRTWDRLPPNKRMRRFMDYVSDMTSTQTLKHDTYPVALSDIRPGDVYVTPGVHSYQIVNITETGIAEVTSSTTPKAPRYLARYESFPFYVPEDTKRMSDGYRRFKQPKNLHKSMQKQPDFSDEQYRVAEEVNHNYVGFTDIISSKLGTRKEKPAEKSLRLLTALCMYSNDRGVYVYDALYHLQEIRGKGRRCLNRTEYDNFSTPTRDKRLRQFFDAVRQHIKTSYHLDKNSHSQRWAAALFSEKEPHPRDLQQLNKFCKVELSLQSGYFMSLRELREKSDAGVLVSNPNAPLDYRWGITTEPPYKASCPTY